MLTEFCASEGLGQSCTNTASFHPHGAHSAVTIIILLYRWEVKADEVSNLPKWPHWVLAPAAWCAGMPTRSGPSWGHPHLMGGAPWFYLRAQFSLWRGAEKQLGSLGLSSPVFWKILFTLLPFPGFIKSFSLVYWAIPQFHQQTLLFFFFFFSCGTQTPSWSM